MKTQAKNYVAQAIRGLEEFRKPKDQVLLNPYLNMLRQAVHFALPTDGDILDNQVAGLVEALTGPIRLPFPALTLEFDTSPQSLPSRVVLLLWEREMKEDTGRYQKFLMELWGIGPAWSPQTQVTELPENWDDVVPRGSNIAIPVKLHGIDSVLNIGGTGRSAEPSMNSTWSSICTALEFLGALTISNVSHEIIQAADPMVNARRARKKKLPILETRCLTITVPGEKNYQVGSSLDGVNSPDRSSPRQHLRRGHIRRLSEDRRVWVNSCVVGDPAKGKIEKSYKVRPA